MQKYQQLGEEQRIVIATLLKKGYNQSAIAKELEVDKSTISRELRRNCSPGSYGLYTAKPAQERASARARNKGRGKAIDGKMEAHIRRKLTEEDWSPEQVKGRADREGIPMASHETIYRFVYEDKRKGGDLYKSLRRTHRCRRKRRNTRKSRGHILGRVGIEKRPPAVDRQDRFGDWEGDTIVGKGHRSAMATMTERKSLYTVITLLGHRGADHVAERILNDMQGLLCRTITFDNGREFAGHQKIAERLGAKVYFANPYSAWERGCNENANGLIRQYLPKSTPLDQTSHDQAKDIQNKLNNRPRKKLKFKTPNEVFLQQCCTSRLNSANP
jgi:transposase, IS30 family